MTVKMFIVINLARGESADDIIGAVKEKFRLSVTRQQLQKYHPLKANGAELSADLKELFYKTRAEYEKMRPPLAQMIFRVKKLSEFVENAEAKGNHVAAAAFIEQIAKEAGGFYTDGRTLGNRNRNQDF